MEVELLQELDVEGDKWWSWKEKMD